MFTPQGHTILTDFGLALLSEAGTRGEVFGTPHYIAPEQAISSAGVVPQSDLYAVGVILYRLLTGKLPFYGEDALDIAMKHMTEAPPAPSLFRPDLAPAVEQVILKSLAKEPVDRYATGAELTQALQAAVQEAPPAALPPARLSLIDKVILTQNEPLNLPAASPTPPPFMPPVVDVPTPAYTPPPLPAVDEPTSYSYTPTPLYAEEPEAEPVPPPPAAGMPAWLPLAMGVGFGLLAFAVIAWLFSGGGEGENNATPTATPAGVVVVEETATPPAEDDQETPVPAITELSPTEPALIPPVSGPPYSYFFPIVLRN
jgi:serine/threonine protein kinase